MKFKRIIFNIIVISLAFFLFVKWYQYKILDIEQVMAPKLENYKVYLITTDKEYQYWQSINQGASDMAQLIGIDYIWDAPDERDVEKQIEVIRKAVNNGANALIVAADDPRLITEVIEEAKAKDVKIIYVDSPPSEDAIVTLATDNYEAGVIAGKKLLSILENLGINSGSVGIVSIVAKENSELREKGFRDTIKEDGSYKILKTFYSNGNPYDAQAVAEGMMILNEDLVGIFGTNEGTSAGVGYAIKAANSQLIGIGFDKTEAMLKLLQEGNLKAIINQNPYTMGYLGMAQAVAAILNKDTGPNFIDTGAEVIEQ